MNRRVHWMAALWLALSTSAVPADTIEAYPLSVYNGDDLVMKLRLHVQLGGQSLEQREFSFLRAWFASRSGEPGGLLDAKSAEWAIRHNPLNRLAPDSRARPEELGIKSGESVTPDDLARRWMRQSSARFLRLDAAPATPPYGESLTRALIAALDRDRDGKLTKTELQAAEKVLLAKYDVDEDECITPFELVPSLLTDALPRKQRTVLRLELSHPENAKEEKHDREMTIRVDDPRQGRRFVRVGDWLLDVSNQRAEEAASLAAPVAPTARQKYAAAADSDGDGTVTDAEWKAYFAHYRKAAESLVTLTVSPRPRGWFEILDANGDGQLSVPELRSAWERLADEESRKAGFVPAPERNARILTFTFVRGANGAHGIPLVKRLAAGRGSSWFQAMDRNGDGYVSGPEFVGTREQFRRFDRDNDGLISPEEAGAYR